MNVFKDDPSLIYQIRQGIERECLRVDTDAKVSLKPHPSALGSKLTHLNTTTDYSENLLEFITGVHESTNSLFTELEQLHGNTQHHIGDEILWPSSMPGILPAEEQIPLADFGESNTGKLKTLYRKGLGHRYGRSMQSIAGLHYNFSLTDNFWKYLRSVESKSEPSTESEKKDLQEYKNKKYFHLIRNFQRHKWILTYLFGATPVVNESFLTGKKNNLVRFNSSSFHTPYGTSLRMGGLGYTSAAQENIGICYNQVSSYIESLEEARLMSYPEYEKIGKSDENGYKQLNTNILQIDNEFYSTIRPKNIAKSRESALKALHLRGIEYIEVRLLDIDPFHHLGVSKSTVEFLHLFLIWCLQEPSDKLSSADCDQLELNFKTIVNFGRKEGQSINFRGVNLSITSAAKIILGEIETGLSEVIKLEPVYELSLKAQKEKISDPSLLPSQRVIDELGEKSFIQFSLQKAIENKNKYKISDSELKSFKEYAKDSIDEEARIKDLDKLNFDDFLKKYFEDIKIK